MELESDHELSNLEFLEAELGKGTLPRGGSTGAMLMTEPGETPIQAAEMCELFGALVEWMRCRRLENGPAYVDSER